jgi:hypothetical protein
VRGGQHSGRRTYKVDLCKQNELHVIGKPHFWVDTLCAMVRATAYAGLLSMNGFQ